MGMSPVIIPRLARPADGISPTWRRQRDQPLTGSLLVSLRTVETLRCWSYPHLESLLGDITVMGFPPLRSNREPNSATGIFSSQSPSLQFCWWDFPHLEATVNPTPLLEFSLLWGLKFADTADGISPTRKRQRKLAEQLHIQPIILEIEIRTPKRHEYDNIKFKKANGNNKSGRIQTTSSIPRIYFFFKDIFILMHFIKYIWLHLTRVTHISFTSLCEKI